MSESTPPTSLLRRRPLVFGLLLVVGLLGVVAGAQPWWQARAEGSSVAFSGTEATGGLSQALAVVVLVGVVLALTLGVRGRRVLAVLLGAAGTGIVALALAGQRPNADAVRSRVRQISLADQFDLTATVWPWVFLVAGVGTVVGAVLLGWAAGGWPRRAPRYERARADAAAVQADPQALEADPLLAWRALDEGIDPTGPDPAGAADRHPDPDVHERAARDTMDDEPGQPPR